MFLNSKTLAVGLLLVGSYGYAQKIEVVEEKERSDAKIFCSKVSEQAAKKDCQAWLDQQKKSLGDRLLTAYCSTAELKSEALEKGCMYRSVGELKYILRSYRSEYLDGK